MIDKNNPYINAGLSFQIILKEKENQEIYDADNIEISVGLVTQYLHKVLKVISIKHIGDDLYGLIAQGTNLIGWTKLKDSIKLISKPFDTVRVDLSNFNAPQINRELGFKVDYNLLFNEKNFSSRALYIYEGEVVEAVFNKGLFAGFVYAKDIDRSIVCNTNTAIKQSTTFYQDSSLNKSITLDLLSESINCENVKVDLVFTRAQSARIIIKKKKYWISISDFEDITLFNHLENYSYESYTEKELENLDIITRIEDERNESKVAITKLIKENIALQKYKHTNNSGDMDRYEQLYHNLRNSKLGKIQTKYWTWRNRRRSR